MGLLDNHKTCGACGAPHSLTEEEYIEAIAPFSPTDPDELGAVPICESCQSQFGYKPVEDVGLVNYVGIHGRRPE